MKTFDSHAHISLYPDVFSDISSLIDDFHKHALKVVDNAIDVKSSLTVLANSQKYSNLLLPVIGIHPELLIPGGENFEKDFDIDDNLSRLEKLFKDNSKVIKGVGETGLDYYWLEKSGISHQEAQKIKEKQIKLFEKHIFLAQKYKLPLVIHSRGAEEEAFELVAPHGEGILPKCLFHSFTGSISLLEKLLEAGSHVSFNGILTYPKAEEIRELLKFAWKNFRNQILSETDSPLLTPVPKRGEDNSPVNVHFVVEKMAEITEENPEQVAEQIWANSSRFWSV